MNNHKMTKIIQWMNRHLGNSKDEKLIKRRTVSLEELYLILQIAQEYKSVDPCKSLRAMTEIQRRLENFYEIRSSVIDMTETSQPEKYYLEDTSDVLPRILESGKVSVFGGNEAHSIEVSTHTMMDHFPANEVVISDGQEGTKSAIDDSQFTSEKPEKKSKRELQFGQMVKELIVYLQTNYHLRYNVLSETTELGEEQNHEIIYQPISHREVNTICIDAQIKGIGCWDKDVSRCLESKYVQAYHPFKQYIEQLPAWDGTDRVSALAQRVSHNEQWVNHFHIWMRGMMAQWIGLFREGSSTAHAHTLAPILISPNQGCGKSTFCKSLLPEELRTYYTDSFDVFNANNCDKKLAKCGLINLDEFDSLSKQGQTRLKNHMQKTDLSYRIGNQKQATFATRLAAFIGTTNRRDVMIDPTGSRRFICVEVEGMIDNSPIDYPQLYAQLKQELEEGAPYWLSKEEEKQLERSNRDFYRQSAEEELFFSMYRFAEIEEEGAVQMSATQIYDSMRKKHRSMLKANGANPFAKLLSAYQKPRRTTMANLYCVVRIS